MRRRSAGVAADEARCRRNSRGQMRQGGCRRRGRVHIHRDQDMGSDHVVVPDESVSWTFGSSQSRRASPRKLAPRTKRVMASRGRCGPPGGRHSCGRRNHAPSRRRWRTPGRGSNADRSSTASPSCSVAMTISGPMSWARRGEEDRGAAPSATLREQRSRSADDGAGIARGHPAP